jgi:adenylate kinase
MLVNQVMRGLDAVELLNYGTIIDMLNRAEKRGIVPTADTLRDLKDLRNEIAHEYQIDNIELFFDLVLTSTPILLSIIDNIFDYARQYTGDIH